LDLITLNQKFKRMEHLLKSYLLNQNRIKLESVLTGLIGVKALLKASRKNKIILH